MVMSALLLITGSSRDIAPCPKCADIADQSGRVSLDVTAVDKKQRQRRIAAAAE
jgi:hypothetical protein